MLQIPQKSKSHQTVQSSFLWDRTGLRSQSAGPYGPVFFISLHFELETGSFFPRPDRIFWSGLRSQLTGPYGPVFFNGLQKRLRSGPDRTVASLYRTH